MHFSNLDQATLWSNQLILDLFNELNCYSLDGLIISGDIANHATLQEYEAAKQFLYKICQETQLPPEQISIVPGNHDISWDLAKKAYNLKERADCTANELKDGYYIEVSPDVVRVQDEEKYKQRFAHFSTFYEIFKGISYPFDYGKQYSLDHFSQQNLLILGLNSAWQLDHHYKSRPSIHMGALSNALARIRQDRDTYKDCVKIAVWHHPLVSAWDDCIRDQSFVEQLAVSGFRLFLHGHIHKAETSLYRYDLSQDGRKLDRICAGAFGAPTKELIHGYPWQYNLLKFDGNQLTVYTRKREENNGAWKPDTRWLQGSGKPALDYYTVLL